MGLTGVGWALLSNVITNPGTYYSSGATQVPLARFIIGLQLMIMLLSIILLLIFNSSKRLKQTNSLVCLNKNKDSKGKGSHMSLQGFYTFSSK